jgi:arsenate reductase
MLEKPIRILFLCTHNRCRSILAEALTRELGHPWLQAASAGSSPEGQVHPDTLINLAASGIATDNLHSKSWHDMADFEADYTVAVCQQAAGETCPSWMQKTPLLQWPLPDPSKVEAKKRSQAFAEVIADIRGELTLWLQLLQTDPAAFHRHMQARAARCNNQSLN